MFAQNGLELEDDVVEIYEKRLCPDGDRIKNFWKIKNGYSNAKDRISFTIQAVLCNDQAQTCAPEEDIDFLLEQLYFTMNVVEDRVLFGDNDTHPYRTIDQFHS